MPKQPFIEPPRPPAAVQKGFSGPGYNLIIEFEVGGRASYNPHPELPDLRLSGVTVGVGYDLHQVTKDVILEDWRRLPPPAPGRLAETQPYYGQSAVQPWRKVKDIIVPWAQANDVFLRIDVTREFIRAKRALPGFEALRPNAQAALISLGFNRGWSFVGDNRREMKNIRDLVPKLDYAGMARELRAMIRVWRGTSIERGMTRRRYAEAKLIETP